MPTAPLRPCAAQPCDQLVPRGRCHAHALQLDQQRRPAWITKFYSSKPWQNARNQKRRDSPLCEDCLEDVPMRVTPVQVVDHVIPLTQAPDLALTYDNLRSLCHDHHAAKTHGREQR